MPDPGRAPFRFTFETAEGERMGIIAYAFLANSRPTKNRPDDEHRFQLTYGNNDVTQHALCQDPHGAYTTLLCGIDLVRNVLVGADPTLDRTTNFLRTITFSSFQLEEARRFGWHAWEREPENDDDGRIEVVVGLTPVRFVDYVRFEREALYEEAGERHLLADRFGPRAIPSPSNR